MKTERILLCDGWNIMVANNAVNLGLVDHNTYPVGMILGTMNTVRSLVEKFRPTKVLFIMDGPEAGERRRQLYPDYKGGRRVRQRESKVQIMEGEDNIVFGVEGAFQNQLIKIYEFMKLLPVTVCMIPYCEADDAITYLALKNKEKFECIIVSNDKDYLQLIQPGIMVYRWKTKKLYDEASFLSEHKILTQNYIFKKIMLGDTGDKVPGVKGIGEKTFVRLEQLLAESVYKDIDDFMRMLEGMDKTLLNTKETNAINKALEQKNEMDLGYSMMKLNEDCMLPEQVELLEMQIEEQKNKGLSRLSLKIKMKANVFNKLYNGFNDDNWIQSFVFLRAGVEIIC